MTNRQQFDLFGLLLVTLGFMPNLAAMSVLDLPAHLFYLNLTVLCCLLVGWVEQISIIRSVVDG